MPEHVISGYFYGAISVSQAYVESLSKFLCETYGVSGNPNDPGRRWERLLAERIVGTAVRDAALALLSDRNDLHHLNKQVEQDHLKLEKRAEDCVNLLHTIESEVFAHSFDAGKIVPKHRERWPDAGDSLTRANLRQKW